MTWLRRTHGVYFELTRHFLARMFDGEWSAAPGQWKTVATGAVALLAPAFLLLMRSASPIPEYAGKFRLLREAGRMQAYQAAAMADELALLVFVFAITGLVALLQWQCLFPTLRDLLALAGLPVRPRQVFAARFTAVSLFALLMVVTVNVLPGLGSGPQFLAAVLGCLFVFFTILGIQGVLLNVLPGRVFTRVSTLAQGGLFTVFLLAGLRSWSVQRWGEREIARLPEFGWAPPVWFAGMYEVLSGRHDPFLAKMALRGTIALLGAILLAAASYWLSFRRYRRLTLESPRTGRRAWSPLLWLARSPQEAAVMEFTAKTLARSRAHRMIWLAYIGGAGAIVLNSSVIDGALLMRGAPWRAAFEFLVLFWPLACSVVLLAGFRHVCRLPVELPNWIFHTTESLGRGQWMAAVERVVLFYAVGPVYALLTPVAVAVLGWGLAGRMTALQVLISLALFEMLFHDWQQLPFTCSYLPGKRPLVMIVLGYLAVLAVVVPVLSVLVATASRFLPMFWFLLGGLGAFWLWMRRLRLDGWGESRLIYDDQPTLVPDLGISEIRRESLPV